MTRPRSVWGWAAVALVLRLAFLLRGLDVLDRLFLPDDTWYTLSISRNLAAGLGPTVDGVVATSGFQPLLAWLQVPLHLLGGEALALWGTLVLLALADAGVAFALGDLGMRLSGPRAAFAAGGLWALGPYGVHHALGGLETSLALALSLALVVAWDAAWHPRHWLGVGLLCGLALLARIDTAVLVAALGVLTLCRGHWGAVARTAGVAALVVAPWWAWCTWTFGSPVPESGPAVLGLVADHRARWLETPTVLAWAAGNLWGAPVFDAVGLRQALDGRQLLSTLLIAGPVAFALGTVRQGLRSRTAAQAFVLHGVGIVALYAVHVQALWFFRRYLAPSQAVVALALALLWVRLAPGLWSRGLLAVALTFGAMRIGLLLIVTPAASFDVGHDGVKGYLAPARAAWARLPEGAVVGALQSGALAWTAPPGSRAVNLDGVVDGESARAFADRTLAARARAAGVTHLVDWPGNLQVIEARWGGPLAVSARAVVDTPAAGEAYRLQVLTLSE